ncbi:MAG: ATP-binding protein [Gammaproteobacteria bacterium]
MSLRKQLLIVSLLTLALPWAGCQYIREMESALRVDHETALADGALAVARVLAERWDKNVDDTARSPDTDLYAHPLDAPIALDGYSDDWGTARNGLRDYTASVGKSDSLHVQAVAGEDARYVYLFVNVFDDVVSYLDRTRGPVHDYVLLRWQTPEGGMRDVLIETAAPGAVQARPRGASRDEREAAVRGHWQASTTGYQLELRVNKSVINERLGFVIVDGDGVPMDPPLYAGTVRQGEAMAGALVRRRDDLMATVAEFADPGEQLRVADHHGWLLANVGTLSAGAANDSAQSALTRIYRWILDPKLAERRRLESTGRLFGPDLDGALSGQQSTLWYRRPNQPGVIVAASAPIHVADRTVGTVTLEQQSAAILTLTHSALTRLVNLTVLATATAAVGLLGFATWLSFRIRRLRNAADGALNSEGLIRAAIPGLKARDEIGDLSRSFADLLEQLREYTDYLRSLAGKLSHELRTPLAVVQSSLDNLAAEPMPDGAQVYAERAREGAKRLGTILVSMSEATRVEQSITTAEPERFDLNALVSGACQGYQDTYSEHQFDYPEHDQPCIYNGVPELLIQMLDKLVDNAVDFTPVGGRIQFSLATTNDGYRLAVANEGAPLPPSMQGSLFDSLVSMREGQSERAHLGLGLFIARLIVEFHSGQISGHNLPANAGVEFAIELPSATVRVGSTTGSA